MDTQERDDLNATAESITADLSRLKDVEREKQRPGLSGDQLRELADKAEGIARRVLDQAEMQRDLADRVEASETTRRSH